MAKPLRFHGDSKDRLTGCKSMHVPLVAACGKSCPRCLWRLPGNYLATLPDAYTHVFQGKTQKTQKTDERDLEIGRKRYQEHAEFEMTNTFRIPNGVPYGAPEEPPR
jgi:hypothetical protein